MKIYSVWYQIFICLKIKERNDHFLHCFGFCYHHCSRVGNAGNRKCNVKWKAKRQSFFSRNKYSLLRFIDVWYCKSRSQLIIYFFSWHACHTANKKKSSNKNDTFKSCKDLTLNNMLFISSIKCIIKDINNTLFMSGIMKGY